MDNDQSILPLLARRIANRIGRPFGVNPFPRAFPNALVESTTQAADVFNVIFRHNYWGSKQSRSGMGSEIDFAKKYRAGLSKQLRERGFQKIFDAPCGDLNWMVHLITETEINYSGGDISSLVIDDVLKRNPSLDLRVFDITLDTFPEVDAWHCRDCLFHLPTDFIRRALINFSKSTIPFALITSYRARLMHHNLDVGFGGFRFLDLERAPFFLPTPMARIPDFVVGSEFPRYVCLWSREQITDALKC
jgi:hypothetical protein